MTDQPHEPAPEVDEISAANNIPTSRPSDGELLGHPVGLFYLFFAELWERFSFYGMRALLTLYLATELFRDLQDGKQIAYEIYAAYGSLVYFTPALGGMIADRLIGHKNSIMLGALLMCIGHFTMAFQNESIFYLSLGLLIIGNGFFKPNISTLVGGLYHEGDVRRDGGFTIFYLGINLGAFLSPLVCGYLGQNYGWHYGFQRRRDRYVCRYDGLLVWRHPRCLWRSRKPTRRICQKNFWWVERPAHRVGAVFFVGPVICDAGQAE